jgi:GMP synthase (glutamine-hydrolysing)
VTTKLLVLQHVDREGPDLIANLAISRGMTIETLRPDQGDPLPDPDGCNNTIALILGGPMGVSDRNRPSMAWLQRELDWLTVWHQRRQPVCGICLGAQLLATAAGGSVETLTVGTPPQPFMEVGIGAIHWLADPKEHPLLLGMNPSDLVLHWHGDRIQLPTEAELLGSSLHCPEQVFRIGRHAIGLQCHLETADSSVKRWIAEDRDYVVQALGPHGPTQLQEQWDRLGPQLQRQGRQLFNTILDALSKSQP